MFLLVFFSLVILVPISIIMYFVNDFQQLLLNDYINLFKLQALVALEIIPCNAKTRMSKGFFFHPSLTGTLCRARQIVHYSCQLFYLHANGIFFFRGEGIFFFCCKWHAIVLVSRTSQITQDRLTSLLIFFFFFFFL